MNHSHTPRIRPWLRALAVAAIIAGAVWVAGCGGGSSGSGSTGGGSSTAQSASPLAGLTADQVLDRTRAAVKKATSTRMAGTITSGSQKIQVDLRLKTPNGAVGTLGIGGQTVQILVVGDSVYLKGDEAFFKSVAGNSWNPALGTLLAGKWLKAPASDANFGPLSQFADMQAFFATVLKPESEVTRVAGKAIPGQATVGLKGGKSGEESILTVSDAAEPLPLHFAPVSGPAGDEIRFTEWNADVDLTPPPAAEVLDISAFLKTS